MAGPGQHGPSHLLTHSEDVAEVAEHSRENTALLQTAQAGSAPGSSCQTQILE